MKNEGPTTRVEQASGLHVPLESRICGTAAGAAALLLMFSAFAQYSIDWHTIDGGGGTSTGGVYSVSGTVGQPDASTVPMTGGPYSLTGGFWALYTVQTPGAPHLTITLNPQLSTAELSWLPDAPGWVLQESLSLSPANWVNSPTGTNNPAVVTATLPAKFYRLHRP